VEVADLTAAAPPGALLAVAVAAAGGAAAAAAEAALITLAALIALLVIIMVMPHISRRAEEIARKIQVLMNKVLDSVNEYVRQIEELLIRNPQARERCFEEIARFNRVTAELITLLTTPRSKDPVVQQQHVFRTTNKFREWQQALLDLFNCLDAA
jgi:ABC-type transport system involved in cytochrome bd biosynthesis fused ATPase/permease subunit